MKTENVVIYCRTSDLSKGESPTDSLNHQKNEGLKWFNGTNKGYNLFKIYEDRISGDSSIIERGEGRELISDIENGNVNVIWVHKLDRLQRNISKSFQFRELCEENGVLLVENGSVYDFTTDKSLIEFTLYSMIAELERRRIKMRVNRGMIDGLNNGKLATFRVRFGYKRTDDNTIVRDSSESDIVKQIYDLFIESNFDKLSHFIELSNTKFNLKYSKSWYVTFLTKWVDDYLNGYYEVNKRDEGDGKMKKFTIPTEILISDSVPHLVKSKYESIVSSRCYKTEHNDYSVGLKSLLHCGVCGRRLFLFKSKYGDKFRCCKDYRDPHKNQISHTTFIKVEEYEELVRTTLKYVLTNSEIIKSEFRKQLIEQQNLNKIGRYLSDIEITKNLVKKTQIKLSKLIDEKYESPILGEVISEKIQTETNRLTILKNDLDRQYSEYNKLNSLKETFDWKLKYLEEYSEVKFSTIGIEELSQLAEKFIKKIKISGKNGVDGIEFIFKLPIIGDRLDIDRKDYKKHIRGGGTSKNWKRKFIDVEGVKTLHLDSSKCQKWLNTNTLYF